MQMSNRTAKFLSAILASLLAGAALATMSHSPTHAADDCLSAPKDQTPGGGHWYYRIDRATKRHCWYLREEGEKLSQTAAPDSSPSARRPAPKAETATQRSIADAHAELPAQTRVEPPAGNDAPNPAIPANAAGPQNSPSANAGDADAQSSVVASRWPEQGTSSTVSPPPATSNGGVNARATAAAAPPPAVAAVTLAAADSPAPALPSSIAMLLIVMTGALALAGIVASVVFKFGSARRPRQGKVRARRGIWEPTDDDRIVLPAHPAADAVPRRASFARDLDRADDPGERIAEFFSQLSRRSPT
jgi:hypothetical protein